MTPTSLKALLSSRSTRPLRPGQFRGALSGPRRITHCRLFALDAIGGRNNNGTASGVSPKLLGGGMSPTALT